MDKALFSWSNDLLLKRALPLRSSMFLVSKKVSLITACPVYAEFCLKFLLSKHPDFISFLAT